jgi:MoaA/NifB/PqqE/SkfB family radical SAM enzyme
MLQCSAVWRNYWLNLGKLARGDALLRPLAAAYYVTARCNLACAYCEDFGAPRNAQAEPALPLARAQHVLRVLRGGTDSLILTGGEPLLYPEIEALAAHARHALCFAHITLQTNATLLHRHTALLPLLDRLVVSLDATDAPSWSRTLNTTAEIAQSILDNLRAAARRPRRYEVIVNCVLTPDTLHEAERVLDFCAEHGLLASFSPQAVRNWPRYDLLVSEEYRALIARLIARKQRGAPVAGSLDYLRLLRDFTPYACYPMLVPRVAPGGDLLYPCRPIAKDGGARGGRAVNLLEFETWAAAVARAAALYGPPPRMCTSCFQQCFAEPSLMQAQPLALAREQLRYAPSRRARLAQYAPG